MAVICIWDGQLLQEPHRQQKAGRKQNNSQIPRDVCFIKSQRTTDLPTEKVMPKAMEVGSRRKIGIYLPRD